MGAGRPKERDHEGYTKTERAILNILSDGAPHTLAELHSVMGPSSKNTTHSHITNIRKILRPKGEDILPMVSNRRIFYRQVRLLASAVDGRK